METTAQSGDSDIAEELLRFFVEQKEKECFAAMLYTCYEFIKPDVAMEVRWLWQAAQAGPDAMHIQRLASSCMCPAPYTVCYCLRVHLRWSCLMHQQRHLLVRAA